MLLKGSLIFTRSTHELFVLKGREKTDATKQQNEVFEEREREQWVTIKSTSEMNEKKN